MCEPPAHLHDREESFRTVEEGRRLLSARWPTDLVSGLPHYFGGFIRHCDQRLYLAWHNIIDALRTDKPVTWDPQTQDSLFIAEDPQMMALFWEAMHSGSSGTAAIFARAHSFQDHHRILGIGGGSGAYPIELTRAYPHLRATVFDLPHVCALAQEKITAAGAEKSITTLAGDFHADKPLPAGYDVHLLNLILHCWDEQRNRVLLGKVFDALVPGGQVVVCEEILDSDRTGPLGAALMGINMVAETEGGRNYSEDQYRTWLADAGFEQIQTIRFNAPTRQRRPHRHQAPSGSRGPCFYSCQLRNPPQPETGTHCAQSRYGP